MSKKKKRRKRRNPGKGSNFERDICKLLSRWWTNGKRDDIFWRSAGSGNRATSRSLRGYSTHNSYGDISAVDPSGAPLLDVATFSLKNGYKDCHASALLDKPNKGLFELQKWIIEAQKQHEAAGSIGWLIVHRRRGRASVVYMNDSSWHRFALRVGSAALWPVIHFASKEGLLIGTHFCVIPLKIFLEKIKPQHIKDISERC